MDVATPRRHLGDLDPLPHAIKSEIAMWVWHGEVLNDDHGPVHILNAEELIMSRKHAHLPVVAVHCRDLAHAPQYLRRHDRLRMHTEQGQVGGELVVS